MNATSAWLIVLGFCASAVADDAPKKAKPKFTISKETTFVAGPVDKDGYIDYAAALNERLSKGVTPENNANVLIWKALGPRPEGKPVPPEFFKLLGMDEPPEKGEYFIDSNKFMKEDFKDTDGRKRIDEPIGPLGPSLDGAARRVTLNDQILQASRQPWTAKEYPHVAAWLKANEKSLALFVDATRRPQWFYPVMPSLAGNGLSRSMGALKPGMTVYRTIAVSLRTRAMLKVGEGRSEEAWRDLLACHRLARHVGRGHTAVESLMAIAIDAIASYSSSVFVGTVQADAKLMRNYLNDLAGLQPLPNIAENICYAERILFIETVIDAGRNGISEIKTLLSFTESNFGKGSSDPEPNHNADRELSALLERINWDAALREGNRWFDNATAILQETERTKRQEKLEKLVNEAKQMQKTFPKTEELGRTLRQFKSEADAQALLLGKIVFCSMASPIRMVQGAADRAEQIQRNLHLAFALAAYQREHGKYPEKLDALAPKYLAKVPNDYFTNKPLVYRPNDKGYLLYSFGPNGKDDEGRGRDDDVQCDDISVRMPLPAPVKK